MILAQFDLTMLFEILAYFYNLEVSTLHSLVSAQNNDTFSSRTTLDWDLPFELRVDAEGRHRITVLQPQVLVLHWVSRGKRNERLHLVPGKIIETVGFIAACSMCLSLRYSLCLLQHRGGIAPSFPSKSHCSHGRWGELPVQLPSGPWGQKQRWEALLLLLLSGQPGIWVWDNHRVCFNTNSGGAAGCLSFSSKLNNVIYN